VRSRSLVIVAAFLVALLVLTGVVYAYDSSRSDTIAKGITVAGVDIGGLSPSAARAKLEARYLGALKGPIVVHHDTRTWTLGAREARIAANISAMVDAAKQRTDEGNIISRTWRRLTGGEVRAQLQPNVTYSRAAIVRLLDRVRHDIERPAKDASLAFSPNGFTKVSGRTGLRVVASDLHRQIRAAIVSPTAKRTFVAHTKHVQPKVTDAKLADAYGTVIVINRGAFKLRLFKNLQLVKTYGIAVGQVGLETPAGLYHVQNKQIDPAWHVPNSAWAGKLAGQVIPGGAPNNPIKARWMGIFDGAGIHGTSDDGSIGSAASHGCIRMHIPDVEALYDVTPVGAPVYIS
jgi:lipoprotein-anchoring transpeptidase ErfK/SrfK